MMKRFRTLALLTLAFGASSFALSLLAQTPDRPPGNERPRDFDGPPPFGPGEFPPDGFQPPGFGPRGPGGPGMMQQERKLVAQFDKNSNGRLDTDERKAARVFITQERTNRPARGPMGGRPPGGPRREMDQTPPQPGRKLTPADVKSGGSAPLYDTAILRTLFLEFENTDWEKELGDFNNTDVEVPAKLTVDGKVYSGVGVHFRGASSYMMVPEGRKRSLNVSLDFVDENQALLGHRTLNLLNAHEDASFVRTVLYAQIGQHYLPTPKANFVRVVINGECWGVYVNVEQFNKDFVKDRFGSAKGARWKAPGSPQGRAGLEYLGDDVAAYKRIYEIKSKDEPKSWAALMNLCKVLNETPTNRLEAALTPILDVDGVLKFLALENTLINNDGYWVRASDYSLYEDPTGRFHIIPHDVNETFALPGGPGFGGPRGGTGGGGPRINGVELDPLHAANDARKPLLSKLLAVPALRAKYLGYVREIATTWLDWKKLGPLVEQYQTLIGEDVKLDTRKLDSTEAFLSSVTGESAAPSNGQGFRGPRRIGLKAFADQRRDYLLNLPANSPTR